MKKIILVFIVIGFVLSSLPSAIFAADKTGKINLNEATKEQLVSVGVSDEMADAILELREENESFVDMDELLDVDGMTTSQLRKLKKKLYLEEVAGCNC